MRHSIWIALLVCSTFTACGGCGATKPHAASQQQANKKFSVPAVPTVLTIPEQRAEFIATHYWDNFDFCDTTLVGRADYTEQAFADFVNLLPNLPAALIARGVDTMMSRATAASAMYAHFMELSEKYLYDPNSPLRNEEIYISVLRHIVSNEKLDDMLKVRPQYQLDMVLKNRVGNKATDFTYTNPKGGRARLYAAKGERIILFFYRPDCPRCKEAKEYAAGHEIEKLATVVWVNPDKDTHLDTIYDLRASPTLYLLDKDKTVLLKDAPIQQIETYLKKISI